MREIRFRAWDKKEKKMYRVLSYCFEGHPTITIQYNPVIKKWWEELEIMQYTGLKDKNGKEVVEEDVYRYLNGKIVEVPHLTDHGRWLKFLQEFMKFNGEIIGNIYENPELIK